VPTPEASIAGITRIAAADLERQKWVGALDQIDAAAKSIAISHVTSSCDKCGRLTTMPYDKYGNEVLGYNLICSHGVYSWRECDMCDAENEASTRCDYVCEYPLLGGGR
jgi:hypothetical protein